MKKIASADSKEEKKAFKTLKDAHVTKAEKFYKDLKEKTKLAHEDRSVEVLTFNSQQNMPLSLSPSGDVYNFLYSLVGQEEVTSMFTMTK